MNVPKLRFKEFNDEWDYKIFDELINIKSESYNPSLNKENYKCIELEHINQNTGTINGYCNSQDQKSNKNIFKKNEVLFGKLRPYLKKYWYATFDGVCSSEIWVGKSKNQNIVTNKFIYDLFQSHYFLQLCNLSTGSKMPRADWSFIKEQSIAIPNILEQKKISETLELLDKKIELQSKKIEDLKLFKKGLHDKLFNEVTGNDYLLSDIAVFENGKGHENIIDENGKYILINSKFISTEGNVTKKCSEQLTPLFKNDITMVMSDLPNGKALAKCYYIDENNKYSLNQRICKIKVKDDSIINSKYLFYLLNRNSYYLRFDDGVNQTNLKKDDILSLNLVLPSIKEQERDSKTLTIIDNFIEKENNKLSKLILLKKGLMQSMFV